MTAIDGGCYGECIEEGIGSPADGVLGNDSHSRPDAAAGYGTGWTTTAWLPARKSVPPSGLIVMCTRVASADP